MDAVDSGVVVLLLAAALAAAAADRDTGLADITCSMRRQAACWLQGSLGSWYPGFEIKQRYRCDCMAKGSSGRGSAEQT